MRRAAGNPLLDGSTGGYQWDPLLRVEDIEWKSGASPGHARMTVVPINTSQAVEDLLAFYSVDDQVRIFAQPADGALDTAGKVLFTGALQRSSFNITREGEREREVLELIAVPLPTLENQHTEKLIRGRWLYHTSFDADSTAVEVIESPALPAVFNLEEKPNRHKDKTFESFGGAVGSATPIEWYPFTAEEDPDAQWWTVREAIKSVLGHWIYGISDALDTTLWLETATRDALNGTANTGRWAGLDQRLPELDVHGMGPLDALQAICDAAGFEMSVLPAPASEAASRDYQIRLWRRGAGPENDLKLSSRGGVPSDPGRALKTNDVSQVHGMFDAVPIRNEVVARGRVLIETSVPLKPLWNPGDVDGTTVDGALQDDDGNTSYHQKHIAGREQFGDFGHVGRMWGLDCTGGWAAAGNGYTSGLYQHDSDGFDWVSELGIKNSALDTERDNLGITEDVRWSYRVRHALPLRGPSEQEVGTEYALEVSEDGGSSWQRITSVEFQTLREWFGILLTGSAVANLASVNADALRTDAQSVDPSASWWQLIKDETLQFRLTCTVEADHGARFDAFRQASSGSAYRKGRYLELPSAEQHWRATNSIFNSSGDFQKTAGYSIFTRSGELITQVSDAAKRQRDAGEGRRVSVSASTWLMHLERWQVGDRIRGISGRNLALTSNAGDSERAPSVVGLTFRMGDGNRQMVRLHLSDAAMTEGVD